MLTLKSLMLNILLFSLKKMWRRGFYSSTGGSEQNIVHRKGKGDGEKRSQQQEWNEIILSAHSYPPRLGKLKGNTQADHQLIQT